MTHFTIAAPINATSSFTFSAPSGTTTLSNYLSLNPDLAISIPTSATGINLTALGKLSSSDNSVWRLRNGTAASALVNLSTYNSSNPIFA